MDDTLRQRRGDADKTENNKKDNVTLKKRKQKKSKNGSSASPDRDSAKSKDTTDEWTKVGSENSPASQDEEKEETEVSETAPTKEGENTEGENKEKDATVDHSQEHPFLQQRRRKKKYSKAVMFATTWQWKCILFTIMATLPISFWFALPWLQDQVLGHGYIGQMYHIFTWYLGTMFMTNFLRTSFSTPGRAQDIKTDDQYPVVSDNPDLKMNYVKRWCTSCQTWKPPRTHHCGICDRCTLRMDHHCPYMGNCIGLYNLGYFIKMYFFGCIGMVLGIYPLLGVVYPAVVPFIWDTFYEFISWEWYFMISPIHLTWFWWYNICYKAIIDILGYQGVWFGLLIAGFVAALFIMAGLAAAYVPLIITNSTVIENQLKNSSEYIELLEDVVVPIGTTFYKNHWKENMKEVFGPYWQWRMWLPISNGIPLEVGTHPKACDYACEMLFQRIEEVNTEGVEKTVNSIEDLGIISTPVQALPAEEDTNCCNHAKEEPKEEVEMTEESTEDPKTK